MARRPRTIQDRGASPPIPMPINEAGDYLDAPDLIYVSDLPEGVERDRVERELAERVAPVWSRNLLRGRLGHR